LVKRSKDRSELILTRKGEAELKAWLERAAMAETPFEAVDQAEDEGVLA
jgi:hypothetical protein